MAKSLKYIAAEGTFWISSSTIIIKIIGLFSVFFVLHALAVEQYGMLELALSIPMLLSIFLLPGLDTLVIADMGAFLGRGEEREARATLFSFMRLQYLLAVAAWALGFFGASFFTEIYPISIQYVHAASFLFLLGPLRTTYAVLFRAQLKFFLLSFISFLEELFKFTIVAFLFFTGDLGVLDVITAIAAAQFVTIVVLAIPFVRSWNQLERGGEPQPHPWLSLLHERGIWSILSVYAGNVGKAARLWVIQRILGAEAVGLYAVATGLMGHTMALAPLSTVVAPILPQFVHDLRRFATIFSKAIKYQLIAYATIGVIGAVVFPPILVQLFPDYAPAMPLFQIMLVGLLPIAVLSVVTPAFSALKLQKNFFISVLIKDVVSIVAVWTLITLFGIWGVAYEYVLSQTFYVYERLRRLRGFVPQLQGMSSRIFSFDEDDRLILRKVGEFVGKIIRI